MSNRKTCQKYISPLIYSGNGVTKHSLYRNLVSFVLNDGTSWLNSSTNMYNVLKHHLYYDALRKISFDKQIQHYELELLTLKSA